VNLDFHYSDTWADPSKQALPAAWKNISSIDVLKDSVYQYTYKTLQYLKGKGLLPEMVQIGNEINCGMLFPLGKSCDNKWQELGTILNSGIKAVRDISISSDIKPLVLLHVAQPENVEWWFDKVISSGNVTDFDVVGFSYYFLWSTVTLSDLGTYILKFKTKYNRKVMILETAFPWTTSNADNYNNILPGDKTVPEYAYTPQGQYNYMVKLTQLLIDAGGSGIMYWEPAWITSGMKDLWGTGSSWDNSTFFDFQGNTLPGIDFMNYKY
jgi:arabinogalactan endo-1,4-beta-galactosidase